MEFSVILILGAVTGLSHGAGVLPDVLTAVAEQTVTFTTSVKPPVKPFVAVTWSFTGNSGAFTNIITSGTDNRTNPVYADRIVLFRSTGSLELRNLSLSDDGEYQVSLIPDGEALMNGFCRLVVHEPVSDVLVTSNATDLIEFNSSVSLSCSSSGSSLSFLWMNSSSEVTVSDRVQITDGGSTLTIVSVTRYDQGPYRCQVFNPVSSATSDPVNLYVIYGPENINLTLSPSQEHYDEGSDISLTCSVSSRPVTFRWFLDGDLLPETGSELRLTNIQKGQSGNYSCQAFNNRTERHQTSQVETITVLTSEIANVVITSNSTDLSEHHSSVRLSCSSSGSFPQFIWINSSSEVTVSDRVQITDEGATLTIMNVTRFDQGPFMCHVFNNFSNYTSDQVKLFISYGPEDLHLKVSPPLEHFEEASNISLMCSADSRPPAHFSWFLNGDKLPGFEPELRLMDLQMNQSGNYSCQAFNNKTLKHQTSKPAAVFVQTPVSRVTVVSKSTNLIEFNSSVRLSCSSSGSSLSFLWMNSSSEVTVSDRVQITDGGSTLTIVSVTRYDQGPYRCKASNVISEEISRPMNLLIQYGPDSSAIKGPASVKAGDFTMLYCFTVSVPSAEYTWSFNGKQTNSHEAVHVVQSSRSSDSGTYTCSAVNPATERRQTVRHELTVTDFSNCDCSAAGRMTIITAGCCLIVSVVSGVTVFVLMRTRRVRSRYRAHREVKLSRKEEHTGTYRISGLVENDLYSLPHMYFKNEEAKSETQF